MKILVKFPTGKTITLGVFAGNTMGALKAKLQELEGVSIGRQRLIFAGGQLEDWHAPLSEYNIQNGSIAELQIRD